MDEKRNSFVTFHKTGVRFLFKKRFIADLYYVHTWIQIYR